MTAVKIFFGMIWFLVKLAIATIGIIVLVALDIARALIGLLVFTIPVGLSAAVAVFGVAFWLTAMGSLIVLGFSTWIGTGVALYYLKEVLVYVGGGTMLLFSLGVVMKPTEILTGMLKILGFFYIMPVRTALHQLPDTSRSVGAILVFVCDYDDFLAIRKAANAADLWFASTRFTRVGYKYLYEILVVQKR